MQINHTRKRINYAHHPIDHEKIYIQRGFNRAFISRIEEVHSRCDNEKKSFPNSQPIMKTTTSAGFMIVGHAQIVACGLMFSNQNENEITSIFFRLSNGRSLNSLAINVMQF